MAKSKKAEEQQALVDLVCRNAVIEECAKLVPTSWLDPLLTGPQRTIIDSPCPEIEALLRGIQARIRALATTNGDRT